MTYINEFYPNVEIICINLKNRKDKKKYMTKELTKQIAQVQLKNLKGMSCERVCAIAKSKPFEKNLIPQEFLLVNLRSGLRR